MPHQTLDQAIAQLEKLRTELQGASILKSRTFVELIDATLTVAQAVKGRDGRLTVGDGEADVRVGE